MSSSLLSLAALSSCGEAAPSSESAIGQTRQNVLAHCADKGNSAAYEWIQSVTVGGVASVTGKNGGYLAAPQTFSIASGSTSVALAPGMTGNYTEKFRVYRRACRPHSSKRAAPLRV